MDKAKLQKILSSDEGTKLDFKLYYDLKTETGKKELTKDVIAIANSYGGRGHIVIGVQDKTKTLYGVDIDDYNEEKIQQIIINRCDPPISIRVEDIIYKQKLLMVITIFRSHNKPHQMRQTGAFYIRRGSTTDFARRDELAVMLQQNSLLFDELMPVYHASIDNLDMDKINRYLQKTTGEVYQTGSETILSDIGIIYFDSEESDYFPTIGGLMLFGKYPQQQLPHVGLMLCITKSSGSLDSLYFTGTILKILDDVIVSIKKCIADNKYPVDVIEEAIANALVHRDYFDNTSETLVILSNNAIEIINPGHLYESEEITELIDSRSPQKRNNWMYHRLIEIDGVKRFSRYGRGMKNIAQRVAPYGEAKFITMRDKNLFKVLLPAKNLLSEDNIS